MARQKPIEKQSIKIYRLEGEPLVFRRYENYVSCGVPTDVGDITEEWYDVLQRQGMDRETTLIVTAHGSSMEPVIGDGDIVFIDTAARATSGDLVLAFVDDEALIKEFQYDPDTRRARLIPLNRRYEVIELSRRSQRLRIVGVVKFSFRNLKKKASITIGTPKKGQTAQPSTASTLQKGQAAQPSTASTLQKETADKLHQLIDGKKGKAVALAIYCAGKLGLIGSTDYNSVTEEFGDIGSRQNYNKYRANPNLFTPQEIESTQSFLTSTP